MDVGYQRLAISPQQDTCVGVVADYYLNYTGLTQNWLLCQN